MENPQFSAQLWAEALEAEANTLAGLTAETFGLVVECETLRLIREGMPPKKAAEITADMPEVRFEVLGGSKIEPTTYLVKIVRQGTDSYLLSLEQGDIPDNSSEVSISAGESGSYICSEKKLAGFSTSQLADAVALGRNRYAWLVSELEAESRSA